MSDLDEIKAILRGVAENQATFQVQLQETRQLTDSNARALQETRQIVDSNARALQETRQIVDSNARALQETRQIVDSNAKSIQANSSDIAELKALVRTNSSDIVSLKASIDDLVQMIATQATEAAADRAEMRRMIEEMYGNRGNGNGGHKEQ